jgi:hypothetical protein
MMAARADEQRRRTQAQLIKDGQAAFKALRYDDAIARLSEASGLGPLDAASDKMLAMARKRRGA